MDWISLSHVWTKMIFSCKLKLKKTYSPALIMRGVCLDLYDGKFMLSVEIDELMGEIYTHIHDIYRVGQIRLWL